MHVYVLPAWTQTDGHTNVRRQKNGNFDDKEESHRIEKSFSYQVRLENTYLLALDGDIDFQVYFFAFTSLNRY